jgi:death on curing protein
MKRAGKALTWVPKLVALRVHDEQLRRHGGQPGIRDEGRLDSALARPQTLRGYFPDASVEVLAAALAIGIAKGHPFVDGNKRTAAVVSYLFLQLNGVRPTATEEQLGDAFIAVADGTLPEEQLAYWFSEHATHTR